MTSSDVSSRILNTGFARINLKCQSVQQGAIKGDGVWPVP